MYGMMGGMEKTTVYLTTEQKAALTRAAEAEGRSEARLIRAGIDAVTGTHRVGEMGSTLVAATRGIAPQVAAQHRPRWLDRDAFVRLIVPRQADSALRAELLDLAPGTTDDEPLS